tara:strand:- start:4970 stop:5293 length:324 start_codon:yes stop_codon:yes gene_type:complete
MKYLSKLYNSICEPSRLYFVISSIILIIIGIQNATSPAPSYCIGPYVCDSDPRMVFIYKIIYILFWTWALDTLCRAGYKKLSWFLVIYPVLLMFLLISMLIFSGVVM